MSNNPKMTISTARISLFNKEVVKIFESKSDLEVWNSFNKGDEMAFNYLYRTYAGVLFQFGCQFSKDQMLVQDSIQNLFISLRKKRGSLSEVSNIKGYLLRSIQREVLRNGKKTSSKMVLDDSQMDSFFQIELSPETSFIQRESADQRKIQLQEALKKLTAKQRQAILLFYEEELSYKEIAQIMDFNEVKSARKLIYRALSSLKEFIKPTI
ncbi:RNA polymerase sigma-70 factor (ECF subfamily) [Algoriphagus iocasae]|uniref:RNA polymerase sigma-70 factor (ECF subfamily) n=1 Tax=Algoriphagus iocasae TaxID=1836499 RepID=A0A841MK09_9BACT|nr:sigma-70 family RNA polymerase sigma factor [Algoriphagus iocasae]MBB6325807.1 RNA polymerase sigma-70 factor (ECF subfamily) [Algoriphagus iocasae]